MVNNSNKAKKSNYYTKMNQPARSEFEQLAESSNDAIRIINKDFTIRYINRAFAEMTGVGSEDAIGKRCWEVFPGILCHTSGCRAHRIFSGEKRIVVEIERKKADGTSIPCNVTSSPLKDDAGNIIGVIEQFRDITEQRRMEGQVRESEERYRSLIDLGAKAGEAVVILQDVSGKEGVQTFVSEQWLGITGYSRKKLLGTRFFDLINKEGHSYPISKYKQKILTETISSMFEMQIIGKNGNIIDVELTSAPIVYKGKSANVIYLRDITHRKQIERKIRESEELYRGLFQNVPVAIQEYDFSQVKKYYDQLRAGGVHDFRKQFFVDNPDELINCEARLKLTSINKQAIYLFDVPDAERFMNDMIRTHKEHSGGDNGPRECHIGLAEGKKHFDYEELFQSCEGKWRLLHTWVSVAPGFEDSLSKVYLCFIDISARKKAENELVEYKDHLEDMVMKRTNELEISHAQLEEQISQRIEFTRALVHELKTPLTPMRAASELLASGLGEEPWHSLAMNINKGALGLNKRIDELIDVEKSEMGLLRIEPAAVDSEVFIKHTIDFVSPEALSRGIIFEVDIQPQLPIIHADEERLFQVLLNLFNNAFKFTDPGGTVKFEVRFDGNDMTFKVMDNGKGIAPEDQPYLFYPYHQLKNASENLSGMGLGLALCKSLVELHNGKIWLESALDKGSILAFQIPRK